MQKIIFNQPACLDSEYRGLNYLYTWRCSFGHIWKATGTSVLHHNSRCPKCSNYSIETLQEHAKSKNGKCLSIKYNGVKENHDWQCSEGHQWRATWDSVKGTKSRNGTWCPYCTNKKGTTISILNLHAKSKNGKCLSYEYINSKTKYKWQCERGHVWENIWTKIKGGQWCPYCCGRYGTTIKTLKNFAKSKNGKCLSKKYTNSKTKYDWGCLEEHQWKASWEKVKSGTWCPYCSKNKTTKSFDGAIFFVKSYIETKGKPPSKEDKSGACWNAYLIRHHSISLSKLCSDLGFHKDISKLEILAKEFYKNNNRRPSVKKKDNIGHFTAAAWNSWLIENYNYSLSDLCDNLLFEKIPRTNKTPDSAIDFINAFYAKHKRRPQKGDSKVAGWNKILKKYKTSISKLADGMGIDPALRDGWQDDN